MCLMLLTKETVEIIVGKLLDCNWASLERNLLLYRRQRLKAIWKLKCFNFNPN